METLKISLAAARINANMTQEAVSKALHVGKQTVVRWEKGQTVPSFITLTALSNLYGIPIDNIILPEKAT